MKGQLLLVVLAVTGTILGAKVRAVPKPSNVLGSRSKILPSLDLQQSSSEGLVDGVLAYSRPVVPGLSSASTTCYDLTAADPAGVGG